MRRKPWHWPNHISLTRQNASMNVKVHKDRDGAGDLISGHSYQKSYVSHDLLDWRDFVDRPLHLEDNNGQDPPENADDPALKVCQMGYAPNTVSPCQKNTNYVPKSLQKIPKAFLRHLPFDTHNPIYEHNPTNGIPFENLLQLRAEKVKKFLRLPERWEMAGIGYIQYERLLGNNLEYLIEEISAALGSPHFNEKRFNVATCPHLPHFEKISYNLTNDFRDWITEVTQWDVENLIGFHRPTT